MKKKTSLYEDLAIDKKATPDQIKKAYRQKAKQTHPDNGGKPDEFRTIAKAYNILSDEEKRKRYDNGENPDHINQNTHEQNVLSVVFGIFNHIIDQDIDFTHNNIFDLVRQNLQANEKKAKTDKNKNQKNIKKYNDILRRIKKKDESDIFIQHLDYKIKGCNAIIIQIDEHIHVLEDALKLIKECEYEIDPQYVHSEYFPTSTSTTAGW